MTSRREWITTVGVLGAGALVGSLPWPSRSQGVAAATDLSESRSDDEAIADAGEGIIADAEAPWWALRPLHPGAKLAGGWRVQSLSPVVAGGCVLELAHRTGSTRGVRMHAKGATDRGIAQSRHFDFFIINGAQGGESTPESLGRVVLGLAALVRRNESLAADRQTLAVLREHVEPASSEGSGTVRV